MKLPILTAALCLLALLLGCGGEIDPIGTVRAESASDTWIIERKGFP